MFGFEFIVLVVVAYLLLGPQQMTSLTRFLGQTYRDLTEVSRSITRELDLELARREAEEARARHLAAAPPPETPQLPDAYRRYVEEFGEPTANTVPRSEPGPDPESST